MSTTEWVVLTIAIALVAIDVIVQVVGVRLRAKADRLESELSSKSRALDDYRERNREFAEIAERFSVLSNQLSELLCTRIEDRVDQFMNRRMTLAMRALFPEAIPQDASDMDAVQRALDQWRDKHLEDVRLAMATKQRRGRA